MKVLGPRELTARVQEAGLCIGCGACVELCPYFRNHRGRTARLFDCDLARGRCWAACPKAEVDLDELGKRVWGRPYEGLPLGPYTQAYVAQAGPKAPAGAFQGGGAVTALMTQALADGLIRGAVLTGGSALEPEPTVARTPGEIAACASSKYGAAPTLAALNRAACQGESELGVAATPCQATALAQMGLNLTEREDFSDPVSLVVGLFCNWSLDQRKLNAFLAGRVEPGFIKSMDIPPPPANVLVVRTDSGTLEIPLDQIRPLVPDTCGLCPDMTSEWADLSVGMLEGRPGWNTLLVRTDKGAKLVEAARAAGRLVTEPIPDENLTHLKEAAAAKKRRAVVTARDRGLINTTDPEAHAVLRVPDAVLSEIAG